MTEEKKLSSCELDKDTLAGPSAEPVATQAGVVAREATSLPYRTADEMLAAFKGGAPFLLHYYDREPAPVTSMRRGGSLPREWVNVCAGRMIPVGIYPNGDCWRAPGKIRVSLATPAKPPAAQLTITLRQAERLLRFFGGHDAEVAVAVHGNNLHAWCVECPEEGADDLGPTEVDDDLAMHGRPIALSESAVAFDYTAFKHHLSGALLVALNDYVPEEGYTQRDHIARKVLEAVDWWQSVMSVRPTQSESTILHHPV